MQKSNRLGNEKSPYLLQHKDNPVNWYAWGPEAFEAAKKENKPIFLSIGYSTCHWCHVMEKDSFEKQEVADVLNKGFISIKVDREERPDVDQIYMDAVIGMTGSGGWPMSVFLTHDLKPFFGGTFFYKAQFIQILNKISDVWQNQPEKVRTSADQLMTFLRREGMEKGPEAPVDEAMLSQAFAGFQGNFDSTFGGFGQAPKFPRSLDLSFLLRVYRRTDNKDALKMVTLTLDRMAYGGMYDHLGGGFHRYSTDARWLTPHFEKMLYDNALLAWTYLEAYQTTKNETYASVAREILDYVLRDMTHPDGGFYSAEDADSEGKEGTFYVWKYAELKKLLSKQELDIFAKIYQVTATGNFEEENNILSLAADRSWSVKQDPILQGTQKKLFQIREKRIHPHKDDKILTDWNGLMIAAMAKGYQVLGDSRYLTAAQNAARFIRKNLYHVGAPLAAPLVAAQQGGAQQEGAQEGAQQAAPLLHRYRGGEGRFPGYLDDYAFLIFGLTELYEADLNPEWLTWGMALQKKQDELFWDSEGGGYFFAPQGAADLVVRKKEFHDGAVPSGNSVALYNLIRLHSLFFDKKLEDQSDKLMKAASSVITQYPPGYSMSLVAVDFYLDRSKEIAVVGNPTDPAVASFREFLQKNFLPNKVFAIGGESEGKTIPLLKGREAKGGEATFYICEKNICKKPTTNAEEAKALIQDFKPYEL